MESMAYTADDYTEEQIEAARRVCVEALGAIAGLEPDAPLPTVEEVDRALREGRPERDPLAELVTAVAQDFAGDGLAVGSLYALHELLLHIACIGHWTRSPFLRDAAAIASDAYDRVQNMVPGLECESAAYRVPRVEVR